MDTDAHTRKPHASRASTRQIATRTHVDSRDPEDAHARKGTTKKDGWGKKVYEGHECDSGRARAALLRMERETTLPRSSTRRRPPARVLGVVGGLISQSQRNVVVAAGTNLALTPSHTPTVPHARPRDVRPRSTRERRARRRGTQGIRRVGQSQIHGRHEQSGRGAALNFIGGERRGTR